MKVLNKMAETEESCNSKNRSNCPLVGKYLTSNIYKTQVTPNEPNYKEKFYIQTSETDFKNRLNNHTKSFNLEPYENETELPKKGWTKNFTPRVT